MHGRRRNESGLGPVTTLVLLAGGFAPWCGCQQPVVQPGGYDGPTLTARELGLSTVPLASDGYKLLTETRTRGLFPGAVAVARLEPPACSLTPPPDDPITARTWHVGEIPWEEAMGWNRLADNIVDIREIIVLETTATVVPTHDPDAIAEAARRRDASLCVVYGPGPAPSGSAGLWGVILESGAARPLAFVRAEAGPPDFKPPRTDELRDDLRALLQLRARDDRPPTTQPNPWRDASRPNQPVYIIPGRTMDP